MARGEQAAMWRDAGGGAWVRLQPVLDAMFAGVEDLLVDRVARATGPTPSPVVLDVGCGTGATTLAIARRLGAGARCLGADVSPAMIGAARERAADTTSTVDFVVADAASHRFGVGVADVVASRFGVMFFDAPVPAFANLRDATRPGGALRAVVWRGPEENPFMTRAEQAATPLLTLPERPSGVPGQFGLADPDGAAVILREAGWSHAAVEAVDVGCGFPAAELDAYLGTMGAVGRALVQHDAATRAAVLDRVRPAFEEFRSGEEVRFTAACWLLTAGVEHDGPRVSDRETPTSRPGRGGTPGPCSPSS